MTHFQQTHMGQAFENILHKTVLLMWKTTNQLTIYCAFFSIRANIKMQMEVLWNGYNLLYISNLKPSMQLEITRSKNYLCLSYIKKRKGGKIYLFKRLKINPSVSCMINIILH